MHDKFLVCLRRNVFFTQLILNILFLQKCSKMRPSFVFLRIKITALLRLGPFSSQAKCFPILILNFTSFVLIIFTLMYLLKDCLVKERYNTQASPVIYKYKSSFLDTKCQLVHVNGNSSIGVSF